MSMYVAPEQWSVPDAGDPPPCFRQGDIVRMSWFRLDVTALDGGATVKLSALEVRTELVALLSTCCDLVARNPPKRKGALISPLRPVPKNIARSPEALANLRATAKLAVEQGLAVPANLYYFEAAAGVDASVVHLEALAMVEFPLLQGATKLAELTPDARADLRERLKHHFTRDR